MKRRPKSRPNNITDIWNTIENMDAPNDPEAGARIFADILPETKEENECRKVPTTCKNHAANERRR